MKWMIDETRIILEQLASEAKESGREQAQYETKVREILWEIETRGQEALKEYSEKFDKFKGDTFLVSKEEIKAATKRVETEVMDALKQAKRNIVSFHKQQKQEAFIDSGREGVLRGQLILPLEAVGVYVPGGTAAYPSSVLMNVLPAKIAGVKKIVMVTPPSETGIPDVILAAANIAGVDEIYQVGGAQAIAALAYGTTCVPKVDKIVGPGNIYVASAKKLVFGHVAIDMIAGPSEIGVIADDSANPVFIAADLLSQAEHDERARTFLVTDSIELAKKVEQEVEKQLVTLPRKKIAEKSLADFGKLIVVKNLEEAFNVMNALAPEHLEIQLPEPLSYLPKITNAGSVFLGSYASEPVGDYIAGANHVLPTSGTSRFYSPLGVYDFIKRTQFTYYSKKALEEDRQAIQILARKEGLEAHARAVEVRFEEDNK